MEKQEIGDCSAFQFVMGFEIDPKGVLWLPDNGYVAGSSTSCPPKMVHLNSKTNQIVKVGNMLHMAKFTRKKIVGICFHLLNSVSILFNLYEIKRGYSMVPDCAHGQNKNIRG